MIDENADGFIKIVFEFLRRDYTFYGSKDYDPPFFLAREGYDREPQGYKVVRIAIRKELLEKND